MGRARQTACEPAPAPQAQPQLSTAAPSDLEPQLQVVPRPSPASPIPFQAFVASRLAPPGRVLGLERSEELDLDLVKKRFDTLFWIKQTAGAEERELQLIALPI